MVMFQKTFAFYNNIEKIEKGVDIIDAFLKSTGGSSVYLQYKNSGIYFFLGNFVM